jgi:hypothetical protein
MISCSLFLNIFCYRYIMAFVLIASLMGCIANVVNSEDVENHLNSVIGRKYDTIIGWGKGWNKINEDDSILELEFIRESGCSYAIKIDKKTNTVQSWRFTSLKSKCDDNYAPTV